MPTGKPYIIIPHIDYNDEMVSFLKRIGVKCGLFQSPDDFDVKDADKISFESM